MSSEVAVFSTDQWSVEHKGEDAGKRSLSEQARDFSLETVLLLVEGLYSVENGAVVEINKEIGTVVSQPCRQADEFHKFRWWLIFCLFGRHRRQRSGNNGRQGCGNEVNLAPEVVGDVPKVLTGCLSNLS